MRRGAETTLLKCPDHGYTLNERCPRCGATTRKPGPAKYSPEDPYGAYRRKLKLLDREESNTPDRPAAPAEAGRESAP